MTRIIRFAVLGTVATAAVWFYAAASRWRAMHIAATARIAELERLLAWERQQGTEADEMAGALLRELGGLRETMADAAATHRIEIEALEVALRVSQADVGRANTLAEQALRGIGDRIDALTEEVRAQRMGKPATCAYCPLCHQPVPCACVIKAEYADESEFEETVDHG